MFISLHKTRYFPMYFYSKFLIQLRLLLKSTCLSFNLEHSNVHFTSRNRYIGFNFIEYSMDGYFLSKFLIKLRLLSHKSCSSFNLKHFDVHFTSQNPLFFYVFLLKISDEIAVIVKINLFITQFERF